jgi:hypothetical protein
MSLFTINVHSKTPNTAYSRPLVLCAFFEAVFQALFSSTARKVNCDRRVTKPSPGRYAKGACQDSMRLQKLRLENHQSHHPTSSLRF